SGHWSSITSSVSDLCSGSPQSYSLDSAANVMRGELTLDTDGSLSYSFDPALGSLQGTDDSLSFHATYPHGTHTAPAPVTVIQENAAPVCDNTTGSVVAGAQVA